MDPGIRIHEIKATFYWYLSLWSQYEHFLIGGCPDMNFWKTLTWCDGNVDDRGVTTIALLVLRTGRIKSSTAHFLSVLDFDLQPQLGACTLVIEIMAWKKTLHDSHGPNINAFSWVVAEIYLTIHLRKLNIKLWHNSHEHDGRMERRNYIPLSIWLHMWRV